MSSSSFFKTGRSPAFLAIIILVLQALGVTILLYTGPAGPGILILFGISIIASYHYSIKVSSLFSTISIAVVVVIGYLATTRSFDLLIYNESTSQISWGYWLMNGLTLFLLVLVTNVLAHALNSRLSSETFQREDRIRQLTGEKQSLERRLEAASASLNIRSSQYEIASQIARQITGEIGLENILFTAANQIRDRFGYYHVGIFLNDQKEMYTNLLAAAGEAGQKMMALSHRLRIGSEGMVGYVAGSGEARIALDVTNDAIHYKNPLLPETRSEVALPLRVGEKTIGVLDVQSVIANSFKQEDIHILQIITDQIAIAFDKARLVEDLKRSLAELETSYAMFTKKVWDSHIQTRQQNLAYRYKNDRLETVASAPDFAAGAVINPDRETHPCSRKPPHSVLSLPIQLRKHTLGSIEIHFEREVVSSGTVEFAQEVVNRMAISLENARLLDEIQSRAEREQKALQITARLRSTNDPREMIEIAAQELQSALGATRAQIYFHQPDQPTTPEEITFGNVSAAE